MVPLRPDGPPGPTPASPPPRAAFLEPAADAVPQMASAYRIAPHRLGVATLFLSAFIVGAAVPGTVAFVAATSSTQATNIINDFDDAAAARGWPVPTPTPWPSPGQWQEDARFAYRCVAVYAGSRTKTSHQIQFEQVGWPEAIASRTQYWFPKEISQRTEIPDMNWRVRWGAAIRASGAAGIASLLLLAAPTGFFLALRRRRRIRRGLCWSCGYPTSSSEVCAECGASVRRAVKRSRQTPRSLGARAPHCGR